MPESVKRIKMIRALKGRSTGVLLFPIDERAAGMFKTTDKSPLMASRHLVMERTVCVCKKGDIDSGMGRRSGVLSLTLCVHLQRILFFHLWICDNCSVAVGRSVPV